MREGFRVANREVSHDASRIIDRFPDTCHYTWPESGFGHIPPKHVSFPAKRERERAYRCAESILRCQYAEVTNISEDIKRAVFHAKRVHR